MDYAGYDVPGGNDLTNTRLNITFLQLPFNGATAREVYEAAAANTLLSLIITRHGEVYASPADSPLIGSVVQSERFTTWLKALAVAAVRAA